MSGLLNMPVRDVLGWCWAYLWRGFIWVMVCSTSAYAIFGLEWSWPLFWLCMIASTSDRLIYLTLDQKRDNAH